MKKIILILIIILSTFVTTNAKDKYNPTKDDYTFVHNVLSNEGIDYSDNSCYGVVYGKKMIVLTIYKEGHTTIYYLKGGYVYAVTEIFPDGAEYYGPEE